MTEFQFLEEMIRGIEKQKELLVQFKEDFRQRGLRLDRMLNEIEERRTEDWIRVDCALPEEDVTVLVSCYEEFKGLRVMSGVCMAKRDGSGIWYLMDYATDRQIKVSHWMPLPKRAEIREEPTTMVRSAGAPEKVTEAPPTAGARETGRPITKVLDEVLREYDTFLRPNDVRTAFSALVREAFETKLLNKVSSEREGEVRTFLNGLLDTVKAFRETAGVERERR